MPGPKGVQLPKNLVEDKRFDDQTIYKTDYCFRRPPLPQRRRIGTKETPLHPKDFNNPKARFYSDHFHNISHRELKKHCQKLLSAFQRSSSTIEIDAAAKDKKASLHSDLPAIAPLEDNDQLLSEALPHSFRRIESEWQKEVFATKRERGDIYGRAGAKKWYHQREKEDAGQILQQKLLPGLSDWLNQANEHEKMAVLGFMTSVSESLDAEKGTRIQKNRVGKERATNGLKMEDHLDCIPDPDAEPESINQFSFSEDDQDIMDGQRRLETPHEMNMDEIESYKKLTFRNPTRETIVLEQDKYPTNQRCSSRTSRSPAIKDASPRRDKRSRTATPPCSASGRLSEMKRPTSSLAAQVHSLRPSSTISNSRFISRERNGPLANPPENIYPTNPGDMDRGYKKKYRHNGYHEFNSKRWEDREIEDMADKLAGLRPAEMKMQKFSQMARPESTRHNNNLIPENDVYECPVFGKPSPKDKGNFVISPDWTSERKEPRKSYR